MGDLASGINESFDSQHYSFHDDGSNTTFNYNFDVQYTTANSMADVLPSDHLLVVVDDVNGKADPAMGGGKAGGIGIIEGKVTYVQNTSNFDFLVESSVHEIGHNMGLEHTTQTANFMSYDQSRAFFNRTQILTMWNRSRSGALNQGPNSTRAVQSTNNWLWHSSTNDEPYHMNVQQNELMPLPFHNNNQ